jgi:hypothetical protein
VRLTLLDLPRELLHSILARVAADDQWTVARTCHALHDALSSETGADADADAAEPVWPTTIISLLRSSSLLAYGLASGAPRSPSLCACAALAGDLAMLQHLVGEHNCPMDRRTSMCAARGGHIGILQWARANGCPWDRDVGYGAAEHGHVDLLKWAVVNGCPCSNMTCSLLAETGDLDTLLWLRRLGACDWDEYTPSYAAMRGHFQLLQAVRAQGCNWDTWTCVGAAEGGHDEILRYAISNGCEVGERVRHSRNAAIWTCSRTCATMPMPRGTRARVRLRLEEGT